MPISAVSLTGLTKKEEMIPKDVRRGNSRHTDYQLKLCFMILGLVILWCLPPRLHAESMIPLTVQKGSNLIHLARQFCISRYHWKEVAKVNGRTDPYMIFAGETIYIPLSLLKVEKLSATVASVFGGVYIVSDEKKLKQLVKGDLILPGQTLVTEEEGFTHLIFPDHKYTRISGRSKFTLTYLVRLADESMKAEFFLEKGKITHSVKEQLEVNETFRTRTPVSVTGVRGTEFRVKMTDGETNLVETLSGTVKVDAAGKSVVVKKGEGTVVLKGKSPLKPKNLPASPPHPVFAALYRAMPVVIQAPEGEHTEKYELRISSDSKGETTVLETSAEPGGKFTLLTLPDGIYYGFLTAIDVGKFESVPAEPFRFQVRANPGPPILSSPLNGRTVFEGINKISWLQADDVQKYYLQLAKDVDFREIVEERNQKEPFYNSPELEQGEYFFRVQAIAADGFKSLFSFVDSWKIQPQPSVTTSSEENVVTLQWTAMPGDISYDVQIARDKQYTSLAVDEQKINDARFVVPKELDPGTYYVRLRGVFSDGQVSPWSSCQILVIEPPPFGIVNALIILTFFAAMLL